MCPLIDRHGGRSVKRLAILALLIVGAFASLRLAGASASQVVTWKGNGLDSIVPCSEGQTPCLHWVLTPGGQPDDGTTAELAVNGVDQGQMAPVGNTGALQITAGYPTGGPTSAEAVITSGSVTDNAILTISDGCSGGSEPSPSPSSTPHPNPPPSPTPTPAPIPPPPPPPPSPPPPPPPPPSPAAPHPRPPPAPRRPPRGALPASPAAVRSPSGSRWTVRPAGPHPSPRGTPPPASHHPSRGRRPRRSHTTPPPARSSRSVRACRSSAPRQ